LLAKPFDEVSDKSNEFLNIELKIVDFGIFGSTSGNSGEKINAGSLKFMAPEILLGHN